MVKINRIVLSIISFSFFSITVTESLSNLIKNNKYPKVSGKGILDLSNLNLKSLKGIDDYPNIENVRALIIRDNSISSLEPLADCKLALEGLDAGSNRICDVSVLENFPRLKIVYLDSNKLNDKNLKTLLSLPGLVELYIDDNDLLNDPTYRYNVIDLGKRNVNYFEMSEVVPQEEVETKKVEVAAKETDEICSICWCGKSINNLYTTTCGHSFHKKCLNTWVAIKKNCPYCRFDLKEPYFVDLE